MARSQFQDIIPPEKRSIQRIAVPSRRPTSGNPPPPPPPAPRRKTQPDKENDEPRQRQSFRGTENVPTDLPPQEPRIGLKKFLIMGGIALLVIAAVVSGLIASYHSAGVTVTVVPKEEPVNVDATLSASTDTSEPIQFQTISLTREGELSVPATSVSNVSTKASGTIVIYNAYSTSPQQLIASTRFETPSGLIFRISKAVTVPGESKQGGALVPGSVTAVITANAAGSNYNIGLSDFTLPGLSGTSEYQKIYARSKTPMQGGYSGVQSVVSAAVATTSRAEIETDLTKNLISEAETDAPLDYVLLPDSYFINFQKLPDMPATTTDTLAVEGTFHGFIFNGPELADAISSQVGVSGDSSHFDVGSFSGLTLTFKKFSTSTPWNLSTISFDLTGTTTLVSVIDSASLKTDLAGKPRSTLNALLASYPDIASANVKFKPFWSQYFPEDSSKITIVIATSTSP